MSETAWQLKHLTGRQSEMLLRLGRRLTLPISMTNAYSFRHTGHTAALQQLFSTNRERATGHSKDRNTFNKYLWILEVLQRLDE